MLRALLGPRHTTAKEPFKKILEWVTLLAKGRRVDATRALRFLLTANVHYGWVEGFGYFRKRRWHRLCRQRCLTSFFPERRSAEGRGKRCNRQPQAGQYDHHQPPAATIGEVTARHEALSSSATADTTDHSRTRSQQHTTHDGRPCHDIDCTVATGQICSSVFLYRIACKKNSRSPPHCPYGTPARTLQTALHFTCESLHRARQMCQQRHPVLGQRLHRCTAQEFVAHLLAVGEDLLPASNHGVNDSLEVFLMYAPWPGCPRTHHQPP